MYNFLHEFDRKKEEMLLERKKLEEKAAQTLQILCHQIPNRRVGAEGNRMATRFLAETLRDFGFSVGTPEFDCIDWVDRGTELLAPDGTAFEVFSSPYTLPCEVSAPLVVVETVEELEACQVNDSILMLCGEIAKEQLMPKQFPFYNPAHHQRITALLEGKAPLAVIAATARNPELAGGMYPFPMIEDGDFNIPSTYMKDMEGAMLAGYAGKNVRLTIDSARIPAKGHNVIARKPADARSRLVLCAHIDAKDNTPGALDNGTGVVILALLAELLDDYVGGLQVELLALNGEDHYSAQGHKEYLKDHLDSFNEIALVINTDVAGYKEGVSAYSLYGCSEPVAAGIRETMAGYDSLVEGAQWYQSDHAVFIQHGRPAMAITSDRFMELSTHITHTPKDDVNLVDYKKLVDVALALREVIDRLNEVV